MDGRLARARLARQNDPHEWNSYDHYRTIHETRLGEHPFVDHDTPDTVDFEFLEADGVLLLRQHGLVACRRGVRLEVEKYFETRQVGDNRLQVRGILYRYIAWLPNQHLVLKYHNLHQNSDEYHHRVYDVETGDEVFHEVLTRHQFPTFTEVLDELDRLTEALES